MAPASAGLSPIRSTLDNGVVVLARETRKTPAVAINLAVRAGSACDPIAMHQARRTLLARVIDRGTANRSADQIADEIDGHGITLSINVTRHIFSIVCTASRRISTACWTLLGDMVMSPSVPDHELVDATRRVITAIRQDDDSPAVRASEALMAMLYGEQHPYGRRAKGSVEIVESLTRDRLLALHRTRFAPPELSAVVVGDVTTDRVLDAARRVFSGWRADKPAPMVLPPVKRATERRQRVIPMMNKAQTDIAYGFTTIARDNPAYYAYWLMNVALGRCTRSEEGWATASGNARGLAYYVSSSFDANVLEGPLVIRAGVSPANVERAIASIDEELVRLRLDGLDEKELQDMKQHADRIDASRARDRTQASPISCRRWSSSVSDSITIGVFRISCPR